MKIEQKYERETVCEDQRERNISFIAFIGGKASQPTLTTKRKNQFLSYERTVSLKIGH